MGGSTVIILSLESVQRRATKYILSDFSSDYKTRSNDSSFDDAIGDMFFIKNLKERLTYTSLLNFAPQRQGLQLSSNSSNLNLN